MNLLQFADGIEFVTSIGLQEQAYGGLIDEAAVLQWAQSLPEQVEALLELVEESVRPLVVLAVEAGAEFPEPGYELASEEGEIIAIAEVRAWRCC